MFQKADNKGDYFFSEGQAKKRRTRKKKTPANQAAVEEILKAQRTYRPQRRNRGDDFGGDRGDGFRGTVL